MNTIQSEFNRLGVKKSSQEYQKQEQKQISKTKMSTREIEHLMGVNKQRYRRSNGGAIRSL